MRIGLPRSYTRIAWGNKPAAECPDGHRYKALGNSWAVPVAVRAPQPAKCLTCGGSGWLGGPSYYNPGEGGEPCADCSAQGCKLCGGTGGHWEGCKAPVRIGVPDPDYKAMFEGAVRSLGQISDALAIDPVEASCSFGNTSILEAVKRKNDALLAALQKRPARLLTVHELDSIGVHAEGMDGQQWDQWVQRKFAEANGLRILGDGGE